MQMEHGKNGNIVWPFDEIHSIGKMVEKRSTDFAF